MHSCNIFSLIVIKRFVIEFAVDCSTFNVLGLIKCVLYSVNLTCDEELHCVQSTAKSMDEDHRVHILVEMKQGQCIYPLSWSLHCNFTGDGNGSERRWACTPHPYQPG